MVRKLLAKSYVFLILLLMYVPILVLIIYSFTVSNNIGEWNGFSLDLYARLFRNKDIMIALGNTIIIAIISAICSTVLGTLGAIGVYYSKKRSKAISETITQIPTFNAEIVIALSLVFTFVFAGSYIFKADLFGFWTLLIGHMVLSLPFVYLNVKPKLQQMDPSLYEAALDLGCNPGNALKRVVFPQIFPGIVSGFLLALTLSLDDFIVTVFTTGPGLLNGAGKIVTISTFIQSVIKKKVVPIELRALTTVIFLAVVVAAICVSIYQFQQRKRAKKRIYTRKYIVLKNISIAATGLILIGLVIMMLALIATM